MRDAGFEPATNRLIACSSTIELVTLTVLKGNPLPCRFIALRRQNATLPMLSRNRYSRHFTIHGLAATYRLCCGARPYLSARTPPLPLTISPRSVAPMSSPAGQVLSIIVTVSPDDLIGWHRFGDSSDRSRSTGIAARPSQLAFNDRLSPAGNKVRVTLSPCRQSISVKSNAPPVSRRGALSY